MLQDKPARWVSGYFDPLLAEHVRRLRECAQPGQLLVVEIANPESPLLPQRARVKMSAPTILVVRLGAMGDVVAALPAVASLKHSIPHSKITWVIEPKWSVLLEGNPYIDSIIQLDPRNLAGLKDAWGVLSGGPFA